jgi:hypothetical protein
MDMFNNDLHDIRTMKSLAELMNSEMSAISHLQNMINTPAADAVAQPAVVGPAQGIIAILTAMLQFFIATMAPTVNFVSAGPIELLFLIDRVATYTTSSMPSYLALLPLLALLATKVLIYVLAPAVLIFFPFVCTGLLYDHIPPVQHKLMRLTGIQDVKLARNKVDEHMITASYIAMFVGWFGELYCAKNMSFLGGLEGTCWVAAIIVLLEGLVALGWFVYSFDYAAVKASLPAIRFSVSKEGQKANKSVAGQDENGDKDVARARLLSKKIGELEERLESCKQELKKEIGDAAKSKKSKVDEKKIQEAEGEDMDDTNKAKEDGVGCEDGSESDFVNVDRDSIPGAVTPYESE